MKVPESSGDGDLSLDDLLAADSFEDQQGILSEQATQEDTYWAALQYGEAAFSGALGSLSSEFDTV